MKGTWREKGTVKAESHVWAWVWHSLRWPSQEGGDLSPDIHWSPFNSTPPLIRLKAGSQYLQDPMQNETCSELRLSSEGRKEVKAEVGLGHKRKSKWGKERRLARQSKDSFQRRQSLLSPDPAVLPRPSAGPN